MSFRRPRSRAPRLAFLLSALVALASLPPGLFAQEQAPDAPPARAANKYGGAEFVPGDVLVRFRTEEVAGAVEYEAQYDPGILLPRGKEMARGVVRFGGEGIVPGLRLVKVDPARTVEAIEELSRRPDVLYAEPNFIRRLHLTPNDQHFGVLYGLEKINAPAAWDTTTGSQSVVVGVIDQGFQVAHPDLAPNVWTNTAELNGISGFDDDQNGYIDDTNGWDFVHNDKTVFDSATADFHGTHVAGTIGARGNNGIGVVGVNWQVSLMSLKALDGNSGGGTAAQFIAAYNYALYQRQHGVNLRVLNNSYGGTGASQGELDAIRALSDAGILIVAAAGNGGGDGVGDDNFSLPDFPANYDSPNIIAVASTDSADSLSGFSNFSSRLVSIGAPGSLIWSTYPIGNYNTLSGTSMASPHAAGAAALVCAAMPGITMGRLRGVLAYSGDVIPALQGKTTTGRRLNVANAVARAIESDLNAPAQAANFRVTAQSGRGVTLAWNAPGDDGNSGTAADYDFFFVSASTGERFALPSSLLPGTPGVEQTATVNVPYRNFSGTVEMRAYDDSGNSSTASIAVTVPVNPGSDPYLITESAAQPLSTGGTKLALNGDDKYLKGHAIPFSFPFFGAARTALTVSTNGVLYFSTPQTRDGGDADDVPSFVDALHGQAMIAGLWDDLVIDTGQRTDSGVFLVQPDASRVIYRFHGLTYDTPRVAVNFEIELAADGTIRMRYGSNPRVFPVVGIGGGEPAAYVVASHTREFDDVVGPTNLTNAATVTFAPRPAASPSTVAFAAQSVSVGEAAGSALVTVTRSGGSLGAGTVEVRTVDSSAAVPCADTSGTTAYARCDYATTVETLSFADGEAAKSFAVPVINDAHDEPNETVQLTLTNASAAHAVGAPATLTLTITDDDAPGAANPIFDTTHAGNQFFVRQHYLDFLSREPEAGQPWTTILDNCAAGDASCDRVSVSAAFFGSPEFRLKGFYVFRFYRLAFDRLPTYAEMIPDMRQVTGVDPADLFARRAAYPVSFAQRPEFAPLNALSPADYVNALMNRYGLTSVRTNSPTTPEDDTSKVTLTRQSFIDGLNAATLTRAQVLRAIADSEQVAAAEYNRAFVAMQYFGYLRRDPEEKGFNDWLNTINADPSDSRRMVSGFVNSTEYRLRFGPANQ